jgi:hypothetical protein
MRAGDRGDESRGMLVDGLKIEGARSEEHEPEPVPQRAIGRVASA